ncbi:MAG: hypothetical protein Kow00108_21190 [Calditrichia bacterium]
MLFYGNKNIYHQKNQCLVVYTSGTTPELIQKELLLFVNQLVSLNITLVSGWHSMFEKKLLNLCLANPVSNVIHVLARKHTNLNRNFRHYPEDRFLVINPDIGTERISRHTVSKRDNFILSEFHHFLFLYIHPDGHANEVFEQCVARKKNIFLYNHPLNKPFFWDSVTLLDIFSIDLLACLD